MFSRAWACQHRTPGSPADQDAWLTAFSWCSWWVRELGHQRSRQGATVAVAAVGVSSAKNYSGCMLAADAPLGRLAVLVGSPCLMIAATFRCNIRLRSCELARSGRKCKCLSQFLRFHMCGPRGVHGLPGLFAPLLLRFFIGWLVCMGCFWWFGPFAMLGRCLYLVMVYAEFEIFGNPRRSV